MVGLIPTEEQVVFVWILSLCLNGALRLSQLETALEHAKMPKAQCSQAKFSLTLPTVLYPTISLKN